MAHVFLAHTATSVNISAEKLHNLSTHHLRRTEIGIQTVPMRNALPPHMPAKSSGAPESQRRLFGGVKHAESPGGSSPLRPDG